MAIVTVEELTGYLSNIEWNEQQKLIAKKVLDAVESSLEGRLSGTVISARDPMPEQAAILESGQVATRYPVYAVSSINGEEVVLGPGTPFVDPWTLREGVLRRYSPEAPGIRSYPWGGGWVPHTRAVGSIDLVYSPGWGNVPALWLAILKKTAALLGNTQDDSLQIRNTDATRLPPMPEWTEEELASLGVYRNLSVYR